MGAEARGGCASGKQGIATHPGLADRGKLTKRCRTPY